VKSDCKVREIENIKMDMEGKRWEVVGRRSACTCTAILKLQMFVKSDSYCTGIMTLFCFEVLTAAAMKSPVFWDIRSYSPTEVEQKSRRNIACLFPGSKDELQLIIIYNDR
jgi:hypothetical protein